MLYWLKVKLWEFNEKFFVYVYHFYNKWKLSLNSNSTTLMSTITFFYFSNNYLYYCCKVNFITHSWKKLVLYSSFETPLPPISYIILIFVGHQCHYSKTMLFIRLWHMLESVNWSSSVFLDHDNKDAPFTVTNIVNCFHIYDNFSGTSFISRKSNLFLKVIIIGFQNVFIRYNATRRNVWILTLFWDSLYTVQYFH